MLPTNDKDRKALPILTFLTQYFPDVWPALTRVCVAGNVQHNPELSPTDIKWAREKSKDQLNTAFRHLFDRACGVQTDTDGQYHLAKAIWRLSAQLQLDIEAASAKPIDETTRVTVLPPGWPYAQNGALDADLVGEQTAGPMADFCNHGLTICKVCEFPTGTKR